MDLTKEIIISNGFLVVENSLTKSLSKEFEDYQEFEIMVTDNPENPHNSVNTFFLTLTYGLSNHHERDWVLHIDNNTRCTVGAMDIQTIEHFNKVMDLMEINFKINSKNNEQET